jgi:hypothetical protein
MKVFRPLADFSPAVLAHWALTKGNNAPVPQKAA